MSHLAPIVRLALAGWAACAGALPALAQDAGSAGGSIGGAIEPTQPAVRRHLAPREAAPPPRHAAPHGAAAPRSAGGFDGVWTVMAGGGCMAAGSNRVVISGTRLAGPGVSGTVSPGGAVNTVGTMTGITVLGHGHIAGSSASGTYRQSDGCSGSWSAVRE